MAISPPTAPADALELVRQNAPLLLGAAAFPPTAPDPEIGGAWPVHISTIERLASGQASVVTVRAGWQFPLFAGTRVLGLAEVALEPLRWAALHPPEFVQWILNRIGKAETRVAFDDTDYELRLLQISSASLLAVWLHAEENDLFLPVERRLDDGEESLPDIMTVADLTARYASLALARASAVGTLGA